MKKRVETLLVVLAAACLVGGPPPVRRIVIITLDTTRADHVGVYGSTQVSTPNIDQLAVSGIVFDQATTVAPLTLPAHCSLLTGLLPPRHGVRDNGDNPLAADHRTLAELLRARGFQTAAFVGAAVLQATTGLARGFDVYRDGVTENSQTPRARRRADEVVAEATDWLDHQDGSPFLLWVHLYDAHAPYDPPEPYRSLYPDDPYSAEVGYVDSQVGLLLDALERHGIVTDAAIVIAGDHGEAFGSHGEHGHGMAVYEDVLRVPLVVRVPRIQPRRISGVTSLVDVMPTLLQLAGVPAPPVDGVSVVPAMHGRSVRSGDEAYAEAMYPLRFGRPSARSLREGRFKLMISPEMRLFDLDKDPSEEHDLSKGCPEMTAAMANRLAVIGSAASDSSLAVPVSRDTRERLAALGYTSGRLEKAVTSTAGVMVDDEADRRPADKRFVSHPAAVDTCGLHRPSRQFEPRKERTANR